MASAVENSSKASDRLYAAIGEFLARHRLSVDPAHYAFAHKVLSDPRGPLAAAVVTHGWGLLELRPMRMSLEDIFLSLTTDEAPAAESAAAAVAEEEAAHA